MSTSTPPQPSAPPSAPAPVAGALAAARERLLAQRRRARRGLWIETLGVLGLLAIAYAVPTLLTDRLLRLEWIYRAVLLASFVVVIVNVVRRRLLRPLAVALSDEEMALAVERRSPELEQALISSLQFDREPAAHDRSIESRALKDRVVADVLGRLQAIPFERAIDRRRVAKFGWGLAAFHVFFVVWAFLAPSTLGIWALRNVALSNVDWPRYTSLAFADAGQEVRLPQGDPLTVRVQVDGPVPDQLFLDFAFAGGDRGTEPLSRTGEREFTWSIDAVLEDLTLRVQGGDSLPAELQVRVVERPRIDDLAIRVALPSYMEREPYDVPPTEGELRLPAGATLRIAGRSQKPLNAAFLLFGNDRKVPLAVDDADRAAFVGEFSPDRSGLMVVDVIDTDSLGAGTPPRLLLRVGDDQPPTVEFRLRGIGSSITAHARIPGTLKVRDDFGLRAVRVVRRATEDQPIERGDDVAPRPEEPWADAEPLFGDELPIGALRHETAASVDLARWNTEPDESSAANPIQPGMLFSLRYSAFDNFGPGDPHEGIGETMTFRVVTRDQLVEELRRRQVEQRIELQQIAADEAASTLELGETVNPDEAGDDERRAVAMFQAMARRQQSLGRRVRFVGEAYQRILWEYENNRLIEANKVRQIEAAITVPLASLAKDAFPATARLVAQFARSRDESVRADAVEGYRDIERRIAAILDEMEQAENLAALLEELRNVINLEKQAIDDVERHVRNREENLFNPKKK